MGVKFQFSQPLHAFRGLLNWDLAWIPFRRDLWFLIHLDGFPRHTNFVSILDLKEFFWKKFYGKVLNVFRYCLTQFYVHLKIAVNTLIFYEHMAQ